MLTDKAADINLALICVSRSNADNMSSTSIHFVPLSFETGVIFKIDVISRKKAVRRICHFDIGSFRIQQLSNVLPLLRLNHTRSRI